MDFADFKERLKADLQKTKERLEENSAYVSLRDRFQSQSPAAQKGILIAVFGLIALLILSVPYGDFETSSENISQFETKRGLMRDLLRVQKEINETPELAQPPSIDAVKSRVESDLQAAGLLPQQMKVIQILPSVKTPLASPSQNEGLVEVNLSQLNLREVVDLGYQFQSISPSVKLKDLVVKAQTNFPGYFEVVYRLLVLKIAPEEVAPPEPPPKKGR